MRNEEAGAPVEGLPGAGEAPRVRLVRHGESTSNAGARTSDPASFSLTARGREQAHRIAGTQERRPALIVVSPYARARETAEPLRARYPDVRVEVWPVQEFTYLEPSSCAGTTAAERRPRVERYWSEAGPEDRDGPGAESFGDLLRRVAEARARLEALALGGEAVVFTHAQFLQALRIAVHFPELDASRVMRGFREFERAHPIGNGEWIDGVVIGGRLRLLERAEWMSGPAARHR
jgi:broad specificity phosphatase PhoE